MPIAILGQKSIQNMILPHLSKFYKNNNIQQNYIFFENPSQFSTEIKKQNWNIVITLNQPIDLIYRIKKQNSKLKIIFISPTDKFAVEGYKADISYYLLYPVSFEEFQFAMNKCLHYSNKNNEYIIVNSNWQKIPIFFRDILFAEKNGHNILIHTKNKVISTRMTFKDFLEKTKKNPNLINCVRGALVNLSWVKAVESQNFLMINGERIPIRRQDRKKIKQIYTKYLIDSQNQN